MLLISLLLASCILNTRNYFDELYGIETPRNRIVDVNSSQGDFYHNQVKPIIEQRCVVCHGCYDAPCQLKLSSPAGIDRGASKSVVYDGGRLIATDPSRLFEDANSTFQWREKGFFPVLNERNQSPQVNLDSSLMYQFLKLKKDHPLSNKPLLEENIDLGLNRQQHCPTTNEWQNFAKDHPGWGMPYGLPGLSDREFDTLEKWLGSGALMSNKAELSQFYLDEINKWETFLNGDSLKQQLMSRYVYEHWFLAHLYFDELSDTEYFTLVRSRTPPGTPIERIVTRRPYDDPGSERVYYRLWREQATILSKTHMPYALNDQRLNWMKELFLEADYNVSELPGYEVKTTANPFVSFQAIPVNSRWRFILEESRFSIMNFIKGPVCRGQVALNVINDHFWVVFVNPEIVDQPEIDQFLAQEKQHLRIPSEEQSNAKPLTTWIKYSKLQKKYLKAKAEFLQKHINDDNLNIDLIWDGDGYNKNSALTVFRHFDSASVIHGLVGEPPKTAWLINYALLERIHYLLVAGFDVYGNLGHQLTTRLYMDFLRMEGEFNFLALLPADSREKTRDHWYRGASKRTKSYIFGKRSEFNNTTGIHYKTDDPKLELYQMIKAHLGPSLNHSYDIDHADIPKTMLKQLNRLSNIKGTSASLLPQTAILTIKTKERPIYFTVLHNNAHSNITSLFREKSYRIPAEDTITVVAGFVGDYPGAFWEIDENQVEQFVTNIIALRNQLDYQQFMNKYGIRRTDQRFWTKSDELQQALYDIHRQDAGLLDYNRLENR